ncbi:MAG: hypothetical protein KDC87_20925, partial [Planctomycetes bacterium]|nr:hypothetical protein [Planctomycetota bacterium]
YPVTIDPLTAAVNLVSTGTNVIGSCDVGQQGESTRNPRDVLVAFDRVVSASDHDAYAYLCDQSFGNLNLVMSSSSATYSDFGVSVAYVAGASRWVVGYVRSGQLRFYFHDRDLLTANRGVSVDGSVPFYAVRGLDLGGTYANSTGIHGLCVYWADPFDSRPSQAAAMPLNASTRTIEFNRIYNLGAAPYDDWDRERPSVNQTAGNSVGNNDGWLITWQERNVKILRDDWDIMGLRTDTTGAALGSPVLLVDGGARQHVTQPLVSGVSGYYLVTWVASWDMTASTGVSLHGRRVVWSPGQTTPIGIEPSNTIAQNDYISVLTNHGLAVNHEISTTAVATWVSANDFFPSSNAKVVRLSSGGKPVETTQTMLSIVGTGKSVVSPAVAFALPGQAYQIVYGTSDPQGTNAVFGRRYTYPVDAIEVLYGTGCGAMAIGGHRPYLGNGHYQVSGVSGPPSVPAFLIVGAQPTAVPLAALGMPGCMLNLDILLTVGRSTDANGLVVFPFPLPESVVLPYDVLFQIYYASRGANTLGVQATRGLRAQVR